MEQQTLNRCSPDPKISPEHVEFLHRLPDVWRRVHAEIGKQIFGQEDVIGQLLIAILCRGHCLLIGVPGLAKTLLVNTLANITELEFKRVQFTPDMLPSDITGTEIVETCPDTGEKTFHFVSGPLFTQMLLADEINRTPPKTQAALLEAMQESAVTVAGKTMKLKQPFFVVATQNPIEQEGTYPLPEAQLDRFMFSVNVNYPQFAHEVQMLLRTTRDEKPPLDNVLTAQQLIGMQAAIREIHIPESVAERIVRIVSSTRPGVHGAPPVVQKYVRWGASPRACQYIALAAKAFAAVAGRFNVCAEDVDKALLPVLQHRILLNYHADADRQTVESVIHEALRQIR